MNRRGHPVALERAFPPDERSRRAVSDLLRRVAGHARTQEVREVLQDAAKEKAPEAEDPAAS